MALRKKTKKYPFFLVVILFVAYYVYLELQSSPVATPVVSSPSVQGTTASSEQAYSFPVYFTSPSLPYDGQKEGGIETNLIKLIDSSQTSIDLAVFEFDLEDVAEALIKAHARGVIVRVVYDNEHTESDPQMAEIINSGIPAVADNRSAYMHNKFFVFDSNCVWTGSFNISVNAAFKNNENAVVICDGPLSQNYETEFLEMFAGSFGPKSPSDTPHPELFVNGVRIENYFAPEDNVMSKVVNAVSKSQTSVHFMAFSFTDSNLSDTMTALVKNNIDVSGIFESRGADTTSSRCLSLLQSGANIHLDGNPYTFHHKVIIIDGKTVIFGSFNFSNNADTQNDENLLIVHSEQLALAYESEFQRRLTESVLPQNNRCSNN